LQNFNENNSDNNIINSNENVKILNNTTSIHFERATFNSTNSTGERQHTEIKPKKDEINRTSNKTAAYMFPDNISPSPYNVINNLVNTKMTTSN